MLGLLNEPLYVVVALWLVRRFNHKKLAKGLTIINLMDALKDEQRTLDTMSLVISMNNYQPRGWLQKVVLRVLNAHIIKTKQQIDATWDYAQVTQESTVGYISPD